MKTADPFDLVDPPPASEYRRALLSCCGADDRAALAAHYGAPGHTVSAEQLGGTVWGKGLHAANRRYGGLAWRLASSLGRDPGKVGVAMIATFGGGDGEEITWTMLPQVVAALGHLGWIRPA